MMYVAAILLATLAGSVPALAGSPLDPRRAGEMESKSEPVIEGEDQDASQDSASENHPVEEQ